MRFGVQDHARLIAYRDMVRDLVACSDFPDHCRSLGLVPSGPEVDEWEHINSHERIDALAPIDRDIAETAVLAGEVVHGIFTGPCEDKEDLPMYVALAQAVAYGTITRLVATGKLRVV